MSRSIRLTLTALLAVFAGSASCLATAQSIRQLTVIGDDSLPGDLGTYPYTAQFSWLTIRLLNNPDGFKWQMGPGTDGGLVFNQAQDVGEMLGVRNVFNVPTTFMSIGNGISMDASRTIDMTNLRLWIDPDITSVGLADTVDRLVPLVANVSTLGEGENGWMLNADGSYHLIYNMGRNHKLHLYGTAVVPLPPAVWLFGSGTLLLVSAGSRRRRRASAPDVASGVLALQKH